MNPTHSSTDNTDQEAATHLVAVLPLAPHSDERLMKTVSGALGDSDDAVEAVFGAMLDAGWTLGVDSRLRNIYWPPDYTPTAWP